MDRPRTADRLVTVTIFKEAKTEPNLLSQLVFIRSHEHKFVAPLLLGDIGDCLNFGGMYR